MRRESRRLIRMMCAVDGREHLIGDGDMARGMDLGAGNYRAMCGSTVLAGCLSAPPTALCSRCIAASVPPRPGPGRRARRALSQFKPRWLCSRA